MNLQVLSKKPRLLTVLWNFNQHGQLCVFSIRGEDILPFLSFMHINNHNYFGLISNRGRRSEYIISSDNPCFCVLMKCRAMDISSTVMIQGCVSSLLFTLTVSTLSLRCDFIQLVRLSTSFSVNPPGAGMKSKVNSERSEEEQRVNRFRF